jgi:amino acid adenylation domain-containing protein
VESASYFDKLASTAGQESNLEDYWIKKLSGNPGKTGFPYDNKKIDANRYKRLMTDYKFNLTGADYSKLMKLSSGSHPRLHMILIAGLVSLLFKYTGNKEIIVGTSIYKQDIEGEFINTTLALRNQLQDNITFKELLLQVRQVLTEAVENQNYPIELLLQKLGIPFSKSDDFPLFDIAVLLENIQDITYIRDINPNMFFFFLETGKSVDSVVAYNSSLYKIETIKRICLHFKQLLQQVLFNVELSLADIGILTGEEKTRLLVEFNDTGAKYPKYSSIIELFQQQLEKTPDHIAVENKDNQITYKELGKKSDGLSMILRKKGAAADTIVGLMAAPSLDLVIGILGILKAGAAYLPLDPENPGNRIEFILKDSDVNILVTTSGLGEYRKIDRWEREKVLIDTTDIQEMALPTYYSMWLNAPVTSMAYIIYTSGTTGKPKGVVVDHQGLVNYIWWAAERYVKNETGNFPLFTSISFDLTITSIFTPLITGNVIVMYGNDDNDNVVLIEKIIDDNKVEVVKLTPSHLRLVREKRMNPSAIKCFIVGGEELDASLARDISRNFKNNIEIYNEYGPTETVVGCMYYRFNRDTDTGRSVPIGIPINNMQVYILDIHCCPVPPGAAGELYISGDGVARGYLNNPELTADKFLFGFCRSNRSYRSHISSKLYKTGDQARWLDDRNMEFLGRIDHQVKIRGYRIELGEIESLLIQHDKIKEAVVTAEKDDSEDRQLCAYIIPEGVEPGSNQGFDVSRLKEYLVEKLPHYMVPSFFITLEELPLTSHGKIDRKALPEPGKAIKRGEYTAPQNRVEEKLAEIWSEILKVKKDIISVHANFFELGGHSLKATLLVSKIHKELNAKLPLAKVFNTPNIRELAQCIKELKKEKFVSVKSAEKREYHPLSSEQMRQFIFNRMNPGDITYNITEVMMIEGDLDKKRVEKTFIKLIERHESFRTSFASLEGTPLQIIHGPNDVEFSVNYYEANEEKANSILNHSIKSFDLSQPPLLHVVFIKIGDLRHIVMLEMHHITADRISFEIFVKEFMELYDGAKLPALKVQYKEYCQWQIRSLQSETFKAQENYWRKEFDKKISLLNMPYDYENPDFQGIEGDSYQFFIDKEETTALKNLASNSEGTLFMMFLAIYNVFLAKICRQEDIVIATPTAKRTHSDFHPIIGLFADTLLLRNFPGGQKTFAGFFKEVKMRTLEAFENQDYPYIDMVEKLALHRHRNPDRDAIFNVQFQFENVEIPEVVIPGLKLRPYGEDSGTAKLDLLLSGIEIRDRIRLIFNYKTKLFKRETIEKFVQYFNRIVSAVLENPEQKLSQMEITPEEKRKEMMDQFNVDLEDE